LVKEIEDYELILAEQVARPLKIIVTTARRCGSLHAPSG
jgi:hypothetical protein